MPSHAALTSAGVLMGEAEKGGVSGWMQEQECRIEVGGGEDAAFRMLPGLQEPSGPSASPQTLRGG